MQVFHETNCIQGTLECFEEHFQGENEKMEMENRL